MKKDRIDALGAVSLVAISAMLGLNQVLVKLVNSGMEPVFQTGLRSLAAAPLVILFALVRGKRLSVSDGSLLPGILCGTFFAIEFALLFYGLSVTSVARASVLFYTMPVWLAIAAHFLLNEFLTLPRIIGLILAVTGVATALLSGAQDPGAFIGDLLCLLASFFWMGIALLTRATRLKNAVPEMQLVYQLVVSAPLLLMVATIPGTYAFAMTPALWLIFTAQVIAVATVAYLAWFWVLSIYPASDMASFGFLAPMFGVLFGWLILSEDLGPADITALILVGAGLVLINRKPKQKLAKPT